MSKIQEYINNRHKYRVDTTYQRPAGAWSTEDNQCLIDTILKNEPMPLFFLNYKTDEGIFYIVDGQQRLHAISKFYDNKFKLSRKFSGENNHGKTFNGDSPMPDENRERFLNYNLNFHILEDYDDEKIRMIFSRLQRGKPLTLGERLNAKSGDMVLRMREIAKHPFMERSIGVSKTRYGNYPDAARIIFYEKRDCRDSSTPAIMSFFDDYKNISKDDNDYKNTLTVLNFLNKCFPSEPGEYQFLSKHAWVFALYTMIRDLMLAYSLHGMEKEIKNFIESFHNKIYSEDFRRTNPMYQRFYDNIRGGWSERIIALRRDILKQEFSTKYAIKEKDEKRQINDEQKIEVFEKNGRRCFICKKRFKDYKEPEYHHKEMYTHGGKSSIDNTIILCEKCHDEIHGKKEIKLPTEKELSENENEE